MTIQHTLESVPDGLLLRRLVELLRQSRDAEADLVAHIGEVDARRLYAREASPSMFVYCTERLHLSEAEAYLRIAAARASRAHPVLLDMLADGRLHLTAVARLAPHLTVENRESLLARAVHRTKREIDELVAALQPQADAPALMRKLPERRETPPATSGSPVGPTTAAMAGLERRPDGVDRPVPELRPDGVAVPVVVPGPQHLTARGPIRLPAHFVSVAIGRFPLFLADRVVPSLRTIEEQPAVWSNPRAP